MADLRPGFRLSALGTLLAWTASAQHEAAKEDYSRRNFDLRCPKSQVELRKYDEAEGPWSWMDASRLINGTAKSQCEGEAGVGLPSFRTDPTEFEKALENRGSPMAVLAPPQMINVCVDRLNGEEDKNKPAFKNGLIADYYVAMKRLELGAKGALESIAAIDEILGQPALKGISSGAQAYLPEVKQWHDEIANKCKPSPKTEARWKDSGATDLMGHTVENLRGNLMTLQQSSRESLDLYDDQKLMTDLITQGKYISRAQKKLQTKKGDLGKETLKMLAADAKKVEPTVIEKAILQQAELENRLHQAAKSGEPEEAKKIQDEMEALAKTADHQWARLAAKVKKDGQLGGPLACEKTPAHLALAKSRQIFESFTPPPDYELNPEESARCLELEAARAEALSLAPLLKEAFDIVKPEALPTPGAHDINLGHVDQLLKDPRRIRKQLERHLKDKREQLAKAYTEFLNAASCLNENDCQQTTVDKVVSTADKPLARYQTIQKALQLAPKLDLGQESPTAAFLSGADSHMLSWLKEAQCRQSKRLDNKKTNELVTDTGVGVTLFALTLGAGSSAALLSATGRAAQATRSQSLRTLLMGLSHGATPGRIKALQRTGAFFDVADGVWAVPAVASSLNQCSESGLAPVEPPAQSAKPSCSAESHQQAVKSSQREKYLSCVSHAYTRGLPMLRTNKLAARMHDWAMGSGQIPPSAIFNLAGKAARGVKNYFVSYHPKNVGLKRFLVAREFNPVKTKFGIFAVHPEKYTLFPHEKLFRVKIKGQFYTFRMVDGIFKKAAPLLSRANARSGHVYVPALPTYILLSSLGLDAIGNEMVRYQEKREQKVEQKITEHHKKLFKKYYDQNFFLSDFRKNNFSPDMEQYASHVEQIVAEIRTAQVPAITPFTEEEYANLSAKLKSVLPDETTLNFVTFLALAQIFGEEPEEADLEFTPRERLLFRYLTFVGQQETFKSKAFTLAMPAESLAGVPGSTFRYRNLENKDLPPEPLNFLDAKGIQAFYETAHGHLSHLTDARRRDLLGTDPVPPQLSPGYLKLIENSSHFKEWIETKKPSDAHISYYLDLQRDKEEFYKLYSRMGVQPQTLKNGQWLDIPEAAYDKAYEGWAEEFGPLSAQERAARAEAEKAAESKEAR